MTKTNSSTNKQEWAKTLQHYGCELKDNTQGLSIHVGPKEAKKGKAREPGFCPIARAIRNIEGLNVVEVMVGNNVVNIIVKNPDGTYAALRNMIPYNARVGIRVKDSGGAFPQGHYILPPPTLKQSLAYKAKHTTVSKKKKLSAAQKAMREQKRAERMNFPKPVKMFHRHFPGVAA